MIVAKCVVALFVLAIGAGPYPVVAVAEDVELTDGTEAHQYLRHAQIGDRELVQKIKNVDICARRCTSNCFGKPLAQRNKCMDTFISSKCIAFRTATKVLVKKKCLAGIICKGGRRCIDKSCAMRGQCCPTERKCPNGRCVVAGKCCPNERRCSNGSCVGPDGCCPNDKLCLHDDLFCVPSGTCCPGIETQCGDGSCVDRDINCCPGEHFCGDGMTCVASGSCCTGDNKCTDGSCVIPGTCCSDETRCGDGSCVPADKCCPGKHFCGDGRTCIASGSCCAGDNRCSDATCATRGTCCPGETSCGDGSCARAGACCPGETSCNQAQEFINSTQKESRAEEAGNTTVDVAGVSYNIRYEHQYVEGGAVIVSEAQNGLLKIISCQGDGIEGTIAIEFLADQDPAWLSKMFPLQSVLAIDSDVYGSCDMKNESSPIPSDGYIVIQSVHVISAREVEVSGYVAAQFYSLFEWSNYSFDAVRESGDDQGRLLEDPQTRVFKDVDFQFTDEIKCTLSLDITPHFEVSHGEGFYRKGISMRHNFNFDLGIGIVTIQTCTFTAKGSIKIKQDFELHEPLPVPYLAVKNFAKTPKLGLYYLTKFAIDAEGTLSGTVGEKAALKAGTGIYRFSVDQEFIPLPSPSYGLEIVDYSLLSDPDFSFNVTPIAEYTGKAESFAGFKPEFAFYMIGDELKMTLGAKFGVFAKWEHRSSALAFSPRHKDPEELFPILGGICDQCHLDELSLGARAKSLEAELSVSPGAKWLGLKAGEFRKYPLLENILPPFEALVYCDEDETCNCANKGEPCDDANKCCDLLTCDTASQKCVDGVAPCANKGESCANQSCCAGFDLTCDQTTATCVEGASPCANRGESCAVKRCCGLGLTCDAAKTCVNAGPCPMQYLHVNFTSLEVKTTPSSGKNNEKWRLTFTLALVSSATNETNTSTEALYTVPQLNPSIQNMRTQLELGFNAIPLPQEARRYRLSVFGVNVDCAKPQDLVPLATFESTYDEDGFSAQHFCDSAYGGSRHYCVDAQITSMLVDGPCSECPIDMNRCRDGRCVLRGACCAYEQPCVGEGGQVSCVSRDAACPRTECTCDCEALSPGVFATWAYWAYWPTPDIDGDTVVVSESCSFCWEPSTINGTVHVYAFRDGKWILEDKLTGDGLYQGSFGASVAIHQDTVVVAAPKKNGVWASNFSSTLDKLYVFTRKNGEWARQATLQVNLTEYEFNNSIMHVAIRGDVIVAGGYHGAVLFTRQGGSWDTGTLLSRGYISGCAFDDYTNQLALFMLYGSFVVYRQNGQVWERHGQPPGPPLTGSYPGYGLFAGDINNGTVVGIAGNVRYLNLSIPCSGFEPCDALVSFEYSQALDQWVQTPDGFISRKGLPEIAWGWNGGRYLAIEGTRMIISNTKNVEVYARRGNEWILLPERLCNSYVYGGPVALSRDRIVALSSVPAISKACVYTRQL